MQVQDGQWNDQPAVIVGGGPSLKTFNWRLLIAIKNIIVINMAFKEVPHAAVWFSEDLRVVELIHDRYEWKTFRGVKLFHALEESYIPQALKLDGSLQILKKKHTDKRWSKSLEDGLSYSTNSMVGALNLADILGANPIILLGLDCNSIGRSTENYHSDYPKEWKTGDVQYESFRSDFVNWCAPNLKDRAIINANPKSAVDCWPRIPFEHLSSVGWEA